MGIESALPFSLTCGYGNDIRQAVFSMRAASFLLHFACIFGLVPHQEEVGWYWSMQAGRCILVGWVELHGIASTAVLRSYQSSYLLVSNKISIVVLHPNRNPYFSPVISSGRIGDLDRLLHSLHLTKREEMYRLHHVRSQALKLARSSIACAWSAKMVVHDNVIMY